MTYFNVALIL